MERQSFQGGNSRPQRESLPVPLPGSQFPLCWCPPHHMPFLCLLWSIWVACVSSQEQENKHHCGDKLTWLRLKQLTAQDFPAWRPFCFFEHSLPRKIWPWEKKSTRRQQAINCVWSERLGLVLDGSVRGNTSSIATALQAASSSHWHSGLGIEYISLSGPCSSAGSRCNSKRVWLASSRKDLLLELSKGSRDYPLKVRR